ncbi:quinoprotein dehydrogenase-associated SoxYZ-like carrier [Thiosocius teredinicola]|uniref:quinoprotein dehydrogenase-associated SoxYZ-like carrier n=1 Tax=Thiosocius teredinicola TaxID=1973002 RepID=UPI0009911758
MAQIDSAQLRVSLPGKLLIWSVILLWCFLPPNSSAEQEPNQSLVDSSQWRGANTQEDSERSWQATRLSQFGKRTIIEQQGIIKIQAPSRAENDAIVPVSIKLSRPPGFETINKVYLVVDVNPMPTAGVFTINPKKSLEEIDTRVRVNGYTYIRAIAETSEGILYLDKQWVKSRGAGCSAPPDIDQEEHLKRLGKMRFRLDDAADDSRLVQLMISHPNNTGMQKNQLSLLYIPTHYINEVEVWLGEEKLLHADTTFSISENPSFRFRLDDDETAELTAIAKDTEGNVFMHSQTTGSNLQ